VRANNIPITSKALSLLQPFPHLLDELNKIKNLNASIATLKTSETKSNTPTNSPSNTISLTNHTNMASTPQQVTSNEIHLDSKVYFLLF
jgi:hypothetical protein